MPNAEVPRDRWGHPLIVPPGGGKPIPYLRASSFGDVLEDRSALEAWKQRQIVKGLAARPDLLTRSAAAVALDDRRALSQIVREALDGADTERRASLGTGLHGLCEAVDRGLDVDIPAEYAADVAAYVAATEPFFNVWIERFVVCDELQVAGTPDRVVLHSEPLHFDGGLLLEPGIRIADIKTSGSGHYLHQHAVQLAVYAHADLYDPETGERWPLNPHGIAQDWGLIYHLPAGKGRCDIYAIDLQAGWESAQAALDLRARRKRPAAVRPLLVEEVAA